MDSKNTYKFIDMTGKPCPIPVVEAKKALNAPGTIGVVIVVDNAVATQNLEKMAKGLEYDFSCLEKSGGIFEVSIRVKGDKAKMPEPSEINEPKRAQKNLGGGLTVVISRDTMGAGSDELGKMLLKGFIYSLTELEIPPVCVIFFNSGAYLTNQGYNTVSDLKKLSEKGTEILTCGTCVNFYGLAEPAVGKITDMFGITEKMATAGSILNI